MLAIKISILLCTIFIHAGESDRYAEEKLSDNIFILLRENDTSNDNESRKCKLKYNNERLIIFIDLQETFIGTLTLTRTNMLQKSRIPVRFHVNTNKAKYNNTLQELITRNIHYYKSDTTYEEFILTLRVEDLELFHVEYYGNRTNAGSFLFRSRDMILINDKCVYGIESVNRKLIDVTEDIVLGHSVRLSTLNKSQNYKEISRTRRKRSMGSNTGIKYIEIFLVYDKSAFEEFDQSIEKITKRSLDLINEGDTIYRRYNIRLILDGIEIWGSQNNISVTEDGEITLGEFSEYVTKFLPTTSDHVHLITSETFKNRIAGMAYVGAMCSISWSTGFTTDRLSRSIYTTASILAHEIGHNLGMTHDNELKNGYCTCPNAYCIMHSSVQSPPARHFSSCSVDDALAYTNSERSMCLSNAPYILTRDSPKQTLCGNNIVDEGEECDCGSEYFCTNICCDPKTCRLTKGSECAQGDCCLGCRVASNTTLCRDIVTGQEECELRDYCDGVTVECKDFYRKDGTACDNKQGICYQGRCISLNQQCKHFWGSENTISAHSECYKQVNELGTWFGNCGIKEKTSLEKETSEDTSNQTNIQQEYVPCEEANSLCGMLQCQYTPPRYQVVGWNKWYASVTIQLNETIKECIVGKSTTGRYQKTFGYVWDWTPCGKDKYCFNKKCSEQIFTSNCTNVCQPNGVCSNLNNSCYCFEGWQGVSCNESSSFFRDNRLLKKSSGKRSYDVSPVEFLFVVITLVVVIYHL